MIGRVYRGGRVGGLLRYLYGPGRHNEHVDPHLVGSWGGGDAATLLSMEPPEVDGGYDVGPLAIELEAPLRYAPKRPDQPVWHCALRAAEGDRRLTDAEWGEICEDVMHRTGIAARGDNGGCQWVAVRHDEVSVHLVAVLARRDGNDVRLWRDYHRLREACLAAEVRLGLQRTAPIDGTADPAVTRAESEKAVRTGRREEPRGGLRREVRLAAVHALSTADFFARVQGYGLLVRERHGEAGDLTGYAVAVPGDITAEGLPVWYGGGRLAPDLTLPKLQSRWGSGIGPESSDADEVSRAAAAARAGGIEQVDLVWTSDTFVRRAFAFEGRAGGPLTEASRAFQRATRWPPRRRRSGSTIGHSLNPQAQGPSELVAIFDALAQLAAALETWHDSQGRQHLARYAASARVIARGITERSPVRPSQHGVGVMTTPVALTGRRHR